MTEPRMLTNGRWVCPKCGQSKSTSVSARLCCAVSEVEGPPLPPGEIKFSYPPVVTVAASAGSVEATLAERGARYGDFTDHAAIAQGLQDVMRLPAGWERLTPVQKQALTVIADKIARILSGDPNYTDNWHDIQGYAKLAEDRCAT